MIIHGDCLEQLKQLEDNSIDSVVTDPPYGLKFMNKHWDYDVPSVEVWEQVLRVLKPGGHLLSFGGTRTYHRMVVAIEDAGFEIRDQIQWLYGSGFPKSHNVSKGIDKAAGAEREKIKNPLAKQQTSQIAGKGLAGAKSQVEFITPHCVTALAKQWDGWGTALKPANEPICLARKPFKGTVAKNVCEHGTGALNIDGCRVALERGLNMSAVQNGNIYGAKGIYGKAEQREVTSTYKAEGRWPANVILDEAAGDLIGEASRFFYCPKSSKSERNAGLEGMEEVALGVGDERPSGQSMQRLDGREARKMQNHHPTVKPIKLMQYLVRLVTPHGGTVLDPYCGSGTTGIAAKREGMEFIGIEREAEYVEIARRRIDV